MNPKRKISQTFARWLLICVLVAFAATTLSIWFLQTYIAEQDTQRLLQLNIRDVRQDIVDASNENLLAIGRRLAEELNESAVIDDGLLQQLLEKYDVSEINVVSAEGIIAVTTHSSFLGYDMADGQQSREFLVLLDGTREYVQSYQPVSYDASIFRKYAGIALEEGGFVQVGYDAQRFQQDIKTQVIGVTRNRHVGESGGVILCDRQWDIVSDPYDYQGQNLEKTGLVIDREKIAAGACFTATVYGKPSYCMYMEAEGYIAVAVTPTAETTLSRNVSVGITLAIESIVFIALFIIIYNLLKRQIVDNVRKINVALSQITDGDLDVKVDIHVNEEFSTLSKDINTTVSALKQSIADAEARIDQELEFARSIQHAALPSVFPPYPNRKDFSIFACMDTAKEVGGDFYDFYLLSGRTLVFLVADVSGKGIPAAMFMMQVKTLIKSLVESGMDAAQVFTLANDKLCQNNEAEMFVTAWMGFLDLETGLLTYVNAGHNPPLLRRRGGTFQYVKAPAGLVLAGMEGIRYRQQELQLQPGDLLYLYTDGVTEATDAAGELFGNDRLKRSLDGGLHADVKAVCTKVCEDVDLFVGEAPQFDDITMLSLLYTGQMALKELDLPAVPENLEQVISFVEENLSRYGCPMNVQMQVTLAVEEIFVNIASYAYDPEVGPAAVRLEMTEDPMEVVITFTDRGKPYDPLQSAAPDITLSAEDRQIGGLGILLVKKTMDDVRYEYSEGKNILRIVKRW